jgi:lysophospholipase L1-like esterase
MDRRVKGRCVAAAALLSTLGCDALGARGCAPAAGSPGAPTRTSGAAPAARLGVGKPAFASAGDASRLVDGAFRGPNAWKLASCSATAPCWAAVRVGAGPSKLLVDWSFQDGDGAFSTTAYGGTTVQAYSLEVSADSTNGADGTWAPALDAFTHQPVAVAGNTFIQRSHVVEFANMAWVKMKITASTATSIDELELWDASDGTDDTWFFHGDSITQRCANVRGTLPGYGQQPSFQAEVRAASPSRWPLQVGGGIVSQGAIDAVRDVGAYLAAFPHVKHWFLVMGTNDLCHGAEAYSERAQRWIDAVKAAGREPILVHPIWGNDVKEYCSASGPAFVAAVDALVKKNRLRPAVPLYEATVGRKDLFSEGDVHPNEGGCRVWRKTFAAAAKPGG